MRHRLFVPLVAGAAAALATAPAARAQQPSAPLATLEVGQAAPTFTLTGATRYGILRDPVRLSDFRGKTVVLAFFFKARTRG
jgi:cytochrome oxidase Cu insertion factor (SCO1/SenC/PrrC family)